MVTLLLRNKVSCSKLYLVYFCGIVFFKSYLGNKTPTVKAVLNKIVVEDQQIYPKRKTLHDASKINKSINNNLS